MRRQSSGCPFCDPNEINYRILKETEHNYLIPNKTPYDVWERHKVLDHLMLVPKRHVSSLDDLTDAELLDVSRLTASYEKEGYSIYARADVNPQRSVSHQHTHLIKIDKKAPRLTLYLDKPYIMVNL